MHVSRISGLRVASDVPLAFAEPAPGDVPADVLIRQAHVPTDLGRAAASGPFWSIEGTRFLMSVPQIVRCLVSNGQEIAYEPEPGVDPAEALPFIAGTAFGILLHQRGSFVLRASSVSVGGHTVLFCAGPGAGKSTLAAALALRGFPVLTDDVCLVEFDESGAPFVRPEGRFVRLWGRTIRALELDARRRWPLRRAIEKYYVEAGAVGICPGPVRAIYRLSAAAGPRPAGIMRQVAAVAAITLRNAAYRVRYVSACGLWLDQFASITQLIACAGVFDFRRTVAFAAVPDAVETLTAHWRDLGLEVRT
jgi:hypothetical protein